MVTFLKLIRWPNLLMIVFIQYLIRFSFTEAMNLPHALNHWYFALGVLCSVLLAAGGYIVNDLYDLQTDALNKPKRITIGKGISEDRAWYIYLVSIVLATVACYFLAQKVELESLWMIAPLAASLLYLYAYDLKKRPLIGNILVSLLTAMPVFLVAVFDFLPASTDDNAPLVRESFRVVIYYAIFAFWLNLIREIIKDLEDEKGDTLAGYRTLAIILPSVWVKVLLSLMIGLALYFLGDYNYDLAFQSKDISSSVYVFVAVIIPIVVLAFLVLRSKTAAQYHRASSLTKLIMILGILSMPFFTLAFLYGWP